MPYFGSLDPDQDLLSGPWEDTFASLVDDPNPPTRNPDAQFVFDESKKKALVKGFNFLSGNLGEGGANPLAYLNPATAIISLISGISNVDPVTKEDVQRQVDDWAAKNPNPRAPVPRPQPITIGEDTGYIRRPDLTPDLIEVGIANGTLTVYTNPDGSQVVLDKEGFFQDYSPDPVTDDSGGEPAAPQPSAGGMPDDEWVYPNERIISPDANILGRHTNPDGSIVTVFDDGSQQWEKAPTTFEGWPEEAVNSPILARIEDIIGTDYTPDDDRVIAEQMDRYGVTPAQVASSTGLPVDEVMARYNRAKGAGAGTGTGTGAGEGNGDDTGGDDPLQKILQSPTRTTDALFAPELHEFQRGQILGNLFGR